MQQHNKSSRARCTTALLLAWVVTNAGQVFADDGAEPASSPAAPVEQAPPTPGEQAWNAARAAMSNGPVELAFRDQAGMSLPQGYAFVPVKESTELMRVMGNTVDGRFLGLIFPIGRDEANWFVSLDYEDAGYIKDDDAKDWDAAELLQSLKDGTEAANEQRKEVGVAPIEVTRWVEKPNYDATGHRLIWSAELRLKGGNDPDPGINYNTYLLGREGYISLNLVTTAKSVAADKSDARKLLATLRFKDGKRYQDFNSSTDKVAAYGLAALVAGVAAKKLGLLATLGLFAVKFGKVIFVAIAAAGAGFAKWFKGRNRDKDQTSA
jgi:uncharacterized membrane-anchored protein